MSEARTGDAVAFGAADWLSLAAAPVFAIMALLNAVLGGGPADILCSAAQGGIPISGMTMMYGLMSLFHASAWLKLISSRKTRVRGARN